MATQPTRFAVKPFSIGWIAVAIAMLIGLLIGIGVLGLTPVWFAACVILLGLGFFI